MVDGWVSVNWVAHHRRSEELGQALGAELHFISSDKSFLPFRYLEQWRVTRRSLRGVTPTVIQVMQPPAIALACIGTCRRLRASIIVGDLHTGVFTDPKWRWASGLILGLLRRRGFAVVPNEELAEICRKEGVDACVSYCFISHKCLANKRPNSSGHILVPLAYSFDEPIDEIMNAASRLPQYEFIFTGNAPEDIRARAPRNIRFPGYVSKADYLRLRAGASLILALTTHEMTMQSAGFEALSDALPLVTSPSRVLRNFFGDSAIYTIADGEAIGHAIQHAIVNHSDYCERMSVRRDQQLHDQVTLIAAVKKKASSLQGRSVPRVLDNNDDT